MTRAPDERTKVFWAQALRALPGYPFLPCPICGGVEGCSHTGWERAKAAGHNVIVPREGAPS